MQEDFCGSEASLGHTIPCLNFFSLIFKMLCFKDNICGILYKIMILFSFCLCCCYFVKTGSHVAQEGLAMNDYCLHLLKPGIIGVSPCLLSLLFSVVTGKSEIRHVV